MIRASKIQVHPNVGHPDETFLPSRCGLEQRERIPNSSYKGQLFQCHALLTKHQKDGKKGRTTGKEKERERGGGGGGVEVSTRGFQSSLSDKKTYGSFDIKRSSLFSY